MVRFRVFMILLVTTAAAIAFGLEPAAFDLVDSPQGGWFVPEFSSTIGFSFITSGGRSLGTGSYVGTLSFDLTRNLRADLDIGYARLFDFNGADAGRFIGGLDLDWTPSDNLLLQFHYSGYVPTESIEGF
jgi:hypothetical protein